jgi:hypothetical protein
MTEVLRMNKLILNKLLACSLLFWLAGCAENKYTKTIEQLCPPAADRTAAMTTAERVLAEMHFGIEKFDIDAGYIRTAPLSGAQSFELWRSDSVGSFNRSEADLHSIRRAVEINISEQAGQLCINCRATTQRLSLPQSQAATDQQTVMAHQQQDVKKLKLNREQKTAPTWTDLGRDNQLETEILKRIESRLTVDRKQLAATKKESNK